MGEDQHDVLDGPDGGLAQKEIAAVRLDEMTNSTGNLVPVFFGMNHLLTALPISGELPSPVNP